MTGLEIFLLSLVIAYPLWVYKNHVVRFWTAGVGRQEEFDAMVKQIEDKYKSYIHLLNDFRAEQTLNRTRIQEAQEKLKENKDK